MKIAYPGDLIFEDIPSTVGYYDTPRLIVSEGGLVSMKQAFLRRLGDARRFHGQISMDGRYIKLRPDEEGGLKFSAQGVLTHRELRDGLQQKGIGFPAIYTMDWDAENGEWVGYSGDLPTPPAVRDVLPKKKGGKRRGT